MTPKLTRGRQEDCQSKSHFILYFPSIQRKGNLTNKKLTPRTNSSNVLTTGARSAWHKHTSGKNITKRLLFLSATLNY